MSKTNHQVNDIQIFSSPIHKCILFSQCMLSLSVLCQAFLQNNECYLKYMYIYAFKIMLTKYCFVYSSQTFAHKFEASLFIIGWRSQVDIATMGMKEVPNEVTCISAIMLFVSSSASCVIFQLLNREISEANGILS